MKKIRILIIDDHALVGHAWKVILEAEDNMEVAGVVNGVDATLELLKKQPIDIILLDINMEPINGFEMAELIKKLKPAVKILAVSMHDQPAVVRKMIKCGAGGFVSKNSKKEEMIMAIHSILNDKKFISSDIQQKIAEELISEDAGDNQSGSTLDKLTEKEMEIVKLVKEGLTSKEIAGRLHISYKTVQVHRHNILKKLHKKNTAGLLSLLNEAKFMV